MISGSTVEISGQGANSRASSDAEWGPSLLGPKVTVHNVSRSLGIPAPSSAGGAGDPATMGACSKSAIWTPGGSVHGHRPVSAKFSLSTKYLESVRAVT